MSGIPEIQAEYSQHYRSIAVGGIFGSAQPFGLEAIIYSQEPVVDRVLETEPISPQRTSIKRIVECALVIDPMQMKAISQWLNQKIQDYEKLFGHIPSPEEVNSRLKRDPNQ